MFKIFKNSLIKDLLSYNRDRTIAKKSYKYFKFLFNNIDVNDFAVIGRENYLNKDYENHTYIDLDYNINFDIVNDDIIKQIKDINCIHLGSGAGKIVFLMSFLYYFQECVGVENIFELYELSNRLKDNFLNGKYGEALKDSNISFINDSLLSADLSNKNLIILDYNNTNTTFNNMLENKIINEAKQGCKIIKILKPFKDNVGLKLLQVKPLKTADNKVMFVYYYDRRD